MSKTLHTLPLLISAFVMTACSDNTPPTPKQAETGKTVAAEPSIGQAVHDPLDKANDVAPLVQEAADANKRRIDEQTE